MISVYREKLSDSEQKHKKLTQKYNQISFLRLGIAILAIGFFYLSLKNPSLLNIAGVFTAIILFLILISLHRRVAFSRKIEKTKMDSNQKEILFLDKGIYFSDNGNSFQNELHGYAYDLDIFGEKSLFHHINRTNTFIGKTLLANRFVNEKNEEIVETQKGISELSKKLDWRQHFAALASQINDSKEFYTQLDTWISKKEDFFPVFLNYFFKISPFLLFTCLILAFGFEISGFQRWAILIFLVNIAVFGFYLNKILRNKIGFEGTHTLLNQFKKSILTIENEQFQSKILKETQQKLINENVTASKNIEKLSNLIDNLDNMLNIFSIFLNGFTFYHLYTYEKLIQWKQKHGKFIKQWLETVGEFEVFHSFATYTYNNPEYVFATLNSEYRIEFDSVGHPLINSKERVANSISFSEHPFVILTGSNMAGKSTFLRTLGVNMLLTSMGLPVCAKKASVHPMRLLVSMRLSDSLNDGKSYFFAEIQRIQKIIQTLEKERCFVLLDELLRGTNSEDKQLGTIKIIEKILALRGIGVIATHDLEICHLEEKYPKHLQNKCFEAQIENDTLHFDYKLRNGMCRNKNATFLMKKLNVID